MEEKQLVKFDIETAVITVLDEKYKDIVITDSKSYAFVMEGLREYREIRLKIDDRHKELKKDALEYTRAVDTEWHRLKDLLEPGESRLKDIRKVEDDRKAEIKAEKERKEKERIDKIWMKINEFFPLSVPMDLNSSLIEKLLLSVKQIEIDPQVFMEFSGQAQQKKEESIAALELAYEKRVNWEKEETERKAEAERLAEERRQIEEEKAKIEAEKKAEAEKKQREEIERQTKERLEKEAKEKAEREEQERKEAEEERKRQEALRPDKEKLVAFADGLYNFPTPSVKSPEAKEILGRAIDGIEVIVNNLTKQAKEL